MGIMHIEQHTPIFKVWKTEITVTLKVNWYNICSDCDICRTIVNTELIIVPPLCISKVEIGISAKLKHHII